MILKSFPYIAKRFLSLSKTIFNPHSSVIYCISAKSEEREKGKRESRMNEGRKGKEGRSILGGVEKGNLVISFGW